MVASDTSVKRENISNNLKQVTISNILISDVNWWEIYYIIVGVGFFRLRRSLLSETVPLH